MEIYFPDTRRHVVVLFGICDPEYAIRSATRKIRCSGDKREKKIIRIFVSSVVGVESVFFDKFCPLRTFFQVFKTGVDLL